jgi:hypothetical protein
MNNLDKLIESNRRFLVDGWQSTMRAGNVFGHETRTHKGNSNITPTHFSKILDRIITASKHLQGYDSPAELIDKLKSEGIDLMDILEIIENE